jgi:transcriptional regulator with XRE-family HTH domain
MKLLEYRKKENKTQKEMAELLGISLDVYNSWEYGKRIPTRNNMKNIVEKTNGEVTANDFYDVGEKRWKH